MCSVPEFSTEKRSCSGKCGGGGGCHSSSLFRKPAVWLIAAHEGKIRFCNAEGTGAMSSAAAFSSEAIRQRLQEAVQNGEVDQFILVGLPGDIEWLRFCLGDSLSGRVLADICSPVPEVVFSKNDSMALRAKVRG